MTSASLSSWPSRLLVNTDEKASYDCAFDFGGAAAADAAAADAAAAAAGAGAGAAEERGRFNAAAAADAPKLIELPASAMRDAALESRKRPPPPPRLTGALAAAGRGTTELAADEARSDAVDASTAFCL